MTQIENIALGREAYTWLRLGGAPERGGCTSGLLRRWKSFWFEHNLSLQRKTESVGSWDISPIFILGLWRSGTTFLHELLTTAHGIVSPNTWECMNPSICGLIMPPGDAVQERPMDRLRVSSTSPQEDEFALLALGVPSVYRGFLDPRRLDELKQYLMLGYWGVDSPPGWQQVWRSFLDQVVAKRQGRLLLKSPNHLFRIHAISALFRDAKYIWLTRDSTDVFRSNRKMWTAMFQRYALWQWDTAELDSFLTLAVDQTAVALSYATANIPRDRLAVIDFQQLTQSPIKALEALNSRLRLGNWDDLDPLITAAFSQIGTYESEPHSAVELSHSTRVSLDKLDTMQAAAQVSHGI